MLPPRPMPQQTAIIPPRRVPWYRRVGGSPRYLVLLIAGILIVGGAAAAGITQLSKSDSPTAPSGNNGTPADSGNDGGNGTAEKKKPAVVPGNVTVAVLNGTTVPNLALQVSREVEAKGFRVDTVANSADQSQQRAESVVLYAPGHRAEAIAVSRRLGITQRQPIDPGSQGVAGDATVVVIVGADRAQ
jgi:hypothetical protein